MTVALFAACLLPAPHLLAETKRLAVISVGMVTEAPLGDDLLFGAAGGTTLRKLAKRFDQAAGDKKIAGVVMLTDNASLGLGQLEELRQAMSRFRAAGKEIHVHATSFGMGDYTLASGADRVTVTPTADVWITGLYGEGIFVRGLLDRLGVHPDFQACGDYKSAAEMFTRTSPSKPAQENQNWLFDGMFETYVKLIAAGRGKEPAQVKKWIDRGVFSAESARQEGVIDGVADRQAFVAQLKKHYKADLVFDKRYGQAKAATIDLSSPLGLMKLYSDLLSGGTKPRLSRNAAIAIVHVNGPIMTGTGGGSPLSLSPTSGTFSSTIREALYDAAEDKNIKAVVLRVDSPGGSALASEIILNATKFVKQRKPIIVSMGNVAGSGGYYVACAADTVFANESTITGSIGVVGGKISTDAMFAKVGVNFSPIKRGENAALFNSSARMTEDERAKMKAWMDEVYDVFKSHVVAIRGEKLKKEIDELAGGRVFTGRQALELGLVDKIGTLDDALKFAAKTAKLEQYEVRVLPKPKSFIELLIGDPSSADSKPHRLSLQTPRPQLAASAALEVVLPTLKQLEPHRAAALSRVLQQLHTLQGEGVVLATPEWIAR
jgi:protease-4